MGGLVAGMARWCCCSCVADFCPATNINLLQCSFILLAVSSLAKRDRMYITPHVINSLELVFA